MRTVRLAIAAVAAVALIPVTAAAAFAAAPANDMPGGAIALSLGDIVKQDTTKATTGTLDAKVNRFCGAPFTNASVWYTYTPSADEGFILDTAKSDYSTGLMVFEGPPSGATLTACGPTSLGIGGTSGTTYYIMAFSDTTLKGGNLVLSLEQGPPSPRLKVTVDPVGKAFSNGDAEISGTYSCKNADYLYMDGQVTQIWRRVKITAYFQKFFQGTCDGTVHTWKKVVTSDNGLFAKGDATANIFSQACGRITCTNVRVKDQTVTFHNAGQGATVVPDQGESQIPAQLAACSAHPSPTRYATSPACRSRATA